MEAAVESVQSDVRLLTDDRDSIRRTFNDLTLKLIHSQVYSVQCGQAAASSVRSNSSTARYTVYSGQAAASSGHACFVRTVRSYEIYDWGEVMKLYNVMEVGTLCVNSERTSYIGLQAYNYTTAIVSCCSTLLCSVGSSSFVPSEFTCEVYLLAD